MTEKGPHFGDQLLEGLSVARSCYLLKVSKNPPIALMVRADLVALRALLRMQVDKRRSRFRR